MSAKRKKQGDSRNFFIGVLSIMVVIETFLLLNPQKTVVTRNHSKTFQSVSFPNALVGNPDKTITRPPTKTFGGDSFGITSPKSGKPSAALKKPSSAGRIAIVLDDWGYHLESCGAIQAIPQPIAVAVLPGLAYSKAIAECAHDHHKMVMLHLPLEPHQYLEHYPSNYIITTNMRQQRVERLLEKNLDEVPFVEGVNNHMGSKATEDRRLMSIIFARLKERKLFFLDSMVTSHSICRDLAREMHVNFTQRDVFLDNKNERGYIENQFAQLAKLARRRGFAIAIGHDRPLTLQIVKEQLEKLQQEGFQIVSVEEFLR